MNIIDQLINTKKEKYDLTHKVAQFVNELGQYEKLARLPKYKHILTSPIMQKKLPLLTDTLTNRDLIDVTVMRTIAYAIEFILGERLELLIDLDQILPKREQERFEIMTNSKIKIKIDENILAYNDEDVDYYAYFIPDLPNEIEEINTNVAKVVVINNELIVSQVVVRGKTEKTDDKNAHIEPFTYDEADVLVTIKNYSNQGHNDYDFATANEFLVSMPTNSQLRYSNDEDTIIVDMSQADTNNWSMHRLDITVIAKLIAKYLPRKEKQSCELKMNYRLKLNK